MSLAFGNLIAGLFAGEFDAHEIIANPHVLVGLFWLVAKFMLGAGILILILNKPIRKLMGEIR
jgi:POT family proton-dependent oligopeptide transporter